MLFDYGSIPEKQEITHMIVQNRTISGLCRQDVPRKIHEQSVRDI